MALAASRELAQLALGECQVDPPPAQAEAVGAKAAEDRLAADQRAVAALPGVEPHRVGPRGEIGAVDRDLSAGPDPVAPLEPHAIGDDDVGLHLSTGGGVGLEVVNVGAAGGVHLERIADAADGPQVVERGPGERGAGLEVLGVDVPAGFPALAILVVGAEVGVHRQGRVAVLHVADELHDVPAVGRDAVALHGDLHARGSGGGRCRRRSSWSRWASRSPRPGGRRCRSGRCTAETGRWASRRAGPGRRRTASLGTASASRAAAGRAPALARGPGPGRGRAMRTAAGWWPARHPERSEGSADACESSAQHDHAILRSARIRAASRLLPRQQHPVAGHTAWPVGDDVLEVRVRAEAVALEVLARPGRR